MKIKLSKKVNCLRCNHFWLPRKKEIRVCPKCNSPYWDRQKIKKMKDSI